MSYSDYQKLAVRDAAKGRKYLLTVYLFLIISALFFVIFFASVKELPVIGCAFLCDLAAIAYIVKMLKFICPFWQTDLAKKCAEMPSADTALKLAAALECPQKDVKYSDGSKDMFKKAYIACKSANVDKEKLDILAANIKRFSGLDVSAAE